jgi:hypothetical protein
VRAAAESGGSCAGAVRRVSGVDDLDTRDDDNNCAQHDPDNDSDADSHDNIVFSGSYHHNIDSSANYNNSGCEHVNERSDDDVAPFDNHRGADNKRCNDGADDNYTEHVSFCCHDVDDPFDNDCDYASKHDYAHDHVAYDCNHIDNVGDNGDHAHDDGFDDGFDDVAYDCNHIVNVGHNGDHAHHNSFDDVAYDCNHNYDVDDNGDHRDFAHLDDVDQRADHDSDVSPDNYLPGERVGPLSVFHVSINHGDA